MNSQFNSKLFNFSEINKVIAFELPKEYSKEREKVLIEKIYLNSKEFKDDFLSGGEKNENNNDWIEFINIVNSSVFDKAYQVYKEIYKLNFEKAYKKFYKDYVKTYNEMMASINKKINSDIYTGYPFDREAHEVAAKQTNETSYPGECFEDWKKGYDEYYKINIEFAKKDHIKQQKNNLKKSFKIELNRVSKLSHEEAHVESYKIYKETFKKCYDNTYAKFMTENM